MTTVEKPSTLEPVSVLDAVANLLPAIAERASEVEEARRLPRDLLAHLTAAGCFRMLLPRSHGGIGADLPAAMHVVEELASADGSVGWTVMIGAAAWIDLAGLPASSFDALFADGPDVMIAGAFSPSGLAVPVESGYQVSGRWGFASGSPHAEWLYGNCVEETGATGPPRLRIALLALGDAEVEDTWHVIGLRGTGSHHFRVDNVFVPAERTWALMEDEPSVDAPIVRIPTPAMFALNISAAAIGIAQGALADIRALATGKVPLLAGGPLATSPTFHHELATADAQLRAGRALVYDCAEGAWATASARSEFTLEQRARIRAAAAWAVDTAAAVVTSAYRAGGGTSLFVDSPLQRRLRDIHAVTQHFLVRPDSLTTAGAVLAGQEIDVPVF